MAQRINTWSDFKAAIRQLKGKELHEKFSNIVVDTADIAYDLCEKYVCSQNNVSSISDIPYGQGWNMAKKEFDECLRSIPQMGYGLILISHAQDKTFTDEEGQEYNQIVPTLGNGPRLIVDRMSDIIGYAHTTMDESGETKTVLYMRGTPRFIAGSRFKYTPDKIEFTYDNLVNAIGDAIDKQAEETDGDFFVATRTNAHEVSERPAFEDMMAEFKDLTHKIQENVDEDVFKSKWAPKIISITDKYLGKGKKVNDCTEAQCEQLELILMDLKDEVAKGL